MRLQTLLLTAFCVSCGHVAAAETLSYVDLVGRLTDLEHLAVLPEPGERNAQWSSYDRASKYDEATGTYVNWSANGDGGGIIREEDGRLVLAEMDGPGVIWRIWSASAQEGRVRIYLDGQEQPAVDLPFVGYFNRKNAPFTREELAYGASGGFNCYIPISYQKSCRIVAEKGWGMYYHFTYTTYPPATRLPTFRRDLSAEESAALDRANEILARRGANPAGQRPGEVTENLRVSVQPGQTAPIVDLKGPRAITAFKVRLSAPQGADPASTGDGAANDFGVLRELALRMSWDGQAEPSVWSPLGDFFGTAPGVNEYRSLPLGMSKDEFYSYWYMPFGKRAVLELTNDGAAERTVDIAISHAPLTRPMEKLGHFNARWHRDPEPNAKRPIDWAMLKTNGRGRYCGVMLYVWNPKGGWWGEGDEKFFVDGEMFPSTFGTGSEDYFGYAWCSCELFQRAYHNQTVSVARNGCANPTPAESGGHISNNRWHIADNVPFQKSFEGSIEKYFDNERLTRYAAIAYWYEAGPAVSQAPLPGVRERCFEAEQNEMALYRFYRGVNEYDGSGPVEPLRKLYATLSADPALAAFRTELALKMGRAEKAAGHEDRARELVGAFIEPMTEPFVSRDYAADLLAIMGKTKAGSGMISPLLVSNDDGATVRIKKDGRWCIGTQRDQGKLYIYFSLPAGSGFKNANRTARFRVSYYSEGRSTGGFRIQYDSHYPGGITGAYRDSEPVVPPDAAGWHTAVVECPRARLAGHQNNKADFRIAAMEGTDAFIGGIELEPAK